MNKTLLVIRTFFGLICSGIAVASAVTLYGYDLVTLLLGLTTGIGFAALIILFDALLSPKISLDSWLVLLPGLLVGYLLGQLVLLIAANVLQIASLEDPSFATLIRAVILLTSTYIGLRLTNNAAKEFEMSIPFIKFKKSSQRKKDILIDWSILADSRILDIAASGLLDNYLIVPKFVLNELYLLLESSDEATRSKARRCLDVFKKLQVIPLLELRYSDKDYPEFKDPASKLIQLAQFLDANILTGDVVRLQQHALEEIRIINIHMLSNVVKPMVTGEYIHIKVQRYGKEPRQGVGYLDDGAMVVVNGGAEFLGETIKAQVLSVKHTTAGRMIFCNATDENASPETQLSHAFAADMSKNYSTF